jgi:adenine-specific DNA-methyltransferase
MDKLKMHSPNITQDNIARIRSLFPGCVTEAKGADGALRLTVDFDQLQQELTESIVNGTQERYHLNWPGKREALLTANAPIAKTLRPCRDDSVAFDTTRNLFIEGDNLDALKLLQENYLGKIKAIYIDPPYNTGSDLIYEDCFASDLDEYFKKSNQKDLAGNRLAANTEANGRFHSDWLSMIFPRIRLARNLLKDDGFIFISIGNDEVTNLRKVCDEVFGEGNFIECISWNKRIPKNDKGVGNIHEFILVYAKDASIPQELVMRKDGLEDIYDLAEKLKKSKTPIPEAEKEIRKLYKRQGYDRGITLYNSFDSAYRLWGKINMSWPNANTFGPRYEVPHPITGAPVAIPARGWRWKQETFWDAAKFKDGKYTSVAVLHDGSIMCGRIWFAKDEETQPSSITYLDDVNTFLLRSILSLKSDGGIEVEGIFEGKSFFSYPKPTSLLRVLLSAVKMSDGDIVLDFFAGSSTTAHAVLQLNVEDGINRRFIMTQLDEACAPDSEAFKAGYKTISAVGVERIKRAGSLIQKETSHSNWNNDVGFRLLKIDTSNMADIFYSPDQLDKNQISLLVENIKADRNAEDLLFQVMLEWGVDLALPISQQTIQGKEVLLVDGNALAACFDGRGGVDEDFVKELAKLQPLRVVFRDAGFKDSAVKINIEQIFKLLSPATEVKCI